MTELDLPIISIVTPALNSAKYIVEAIESVVNQDYPRFEHIIVDGGSTDGTLDVLSRFQHLRVLSKPDQGLYDATNKGIRLARGDFVGWLNSDDVYADRVFHDLARKVGEAPSAEIVTGDNSMFEDMGSGRRIIRTDKFYTCEQLRAGKLGRRIRLNGCFLRRELFEKLGLFSLDYGSVGDREFLIRLSLYRPVCASLGRVTYHYRIHEHSLTWGTHSDVIGRRRDLRAIACRYISMSDAPTQIRRYCRNIHWETSVAAFRAFARGSGSFAELRAVARDRVFTHELLKRGITKGPMWLAVTPFEVAQYLARRIKRARV